MPRRIVHFAATATVLAFPAIALACPDCASAQQARARLWSEGAALHLVMLLPLPVILAAACAALYRFDRPKRALRLVAGGAGPRHRGALLAAGAALGIGLGGFIDGIVLHQLLQWHSMLSSKVEPIDLVSMKYNMIWDGLFHTLTWLATAAGVLMLWRAAGTRSLPGSGRALFGAMLGGWGAFNLVEGALNHHIYGLHHVHEGRDELAWDLGFMAFGLVLVALGAWLARMKNIDSNIGTNVAKSSGVSGPFRPIRSWR